METQEDRIRHGIRAAQAGLLINAGLVVVKVLTGVLGNSYALIADGIESSTDVFSSLVVWRGLHVSGRAADDTFPYGYGRAETLSAAVVALLLLGAAAGIGIQAVREIMTPHHLPAPFTLVVLALVVLVKETLFRRVGQVAEETGSQAVQTDAWHHRSDAITSAAAFIGIAIALFAGPGWEPADDYAALVAAGVIAMSGIRMLRPTLADLMDRAPDAAYTADLSATAAAVPGVRRVEKLRARRAGLGIFIDLHVEADPLLSLRDAHALSHAVKAALLAAHAEVRDVTVHMEPDEQGTPPAPPPAQQSPG